MKLSNAWLKADFGLEVDAKTLAKSLTMAGLEVDGVTPAAADFSQVVVGEVVDLVPHPDADKLRVASVNTGKEVLQIVCGAANVAKGVRVPVALIGAVLPNNFKIKRSKLRGVESFGMLCSTSELGMSEESSGLLLLPADAPIGMDVREYLSLNDEVLDIDLTPNRADAFSMRGLAREIAMLSEKPLPADFYADNVGISPVAASSDATIDVENQAVSDCPRYLARVIEHVDNTAVTPIWMQERLRRAGVRTHDPLVDITNYVMMLLGTPMHAFDADNIAEKIVIRRAKKGESLTLINGSQAALDEEVLLIADAEKPLAIAGVMGGEHSGCSEKTTRIVLECAWFQPVVVAGKARQFALSSDSAQRFERGVDYVLQRNAIELATQLVLEICGGQAGEVVESLAAEKLPQRLPIHLPIGAIAKRIGRDYEHDRVTEIFAALGCEVVFDHTGWTVTPPTWRFDMEIAEDLIEEVARVDGYDNVPNCLPQVEYQKDTKTPTADARVSDTLVALGFQEAITYSFISRDDHAAFFADAKTVNLFNPISAEMAEMRLSLLPGLVNTLIYNRNRQQSTVRLFELGSIFQPQGEKAVDCLQTPCVAGVMSGLAAPEQWGVTARTVDFFDVKGVVEHLLLGLDMKYTRSDVPYLHPGQSAEIMLEGRSIGRLGMLHPNTLKALGSKGGDIGVFEINMDVLLRTHTPQFTEIGKFPSVRRDLALVVDADISADDIITTIRQRSEKVLQDAFYFDLFTGGNLPEGKKSLAIAIILQSEEKTLQDEEVEGIVCDLVETLKCTYCAELR